MDSTTINNSIHCGCACFASSRIPRVSTPICGVKYDRRRDNIARNPLSTQVFHAGLNNLGLWAQKPLQRGAGAAAGGRWGKTVRPFPSCV